LWNQKEVEAVCGVILNQLGVDDAAWGRVLHGSSVVTFDKHPLIDPLVDNYEGHWWWAASAVAL
jgi:hypothetical protein